MPQLYTVGGCVRDELMGISSKDIDFTFVLDNLDLTVEKGFSEMTAWMESRKFEIFLSTPEMFTIRAKFPKGDPNEKLVADFVMARKEIGYIEGTRKPYLKLGTLEDDLIRRDFTVNAMAKDSEGKLIDLFNGEADLSIKMLRTPMDPMITLMDDPLRMMRAIRFSVTKGFKIHQSVLNAMSQSSLLEKFKSTVSVERVRDELFKMMQKDTVKSMKLLMFIDKFYSPGFMDTVFSKNLWLKPTFEKR